jgi:hypothetical protein
LLHTATKAGNSSSNLNRETTFSRQYPPKKLDGILSAHRKRVDFTLEITEKKGSGILVAVTMMSVSCCRIQEEQSICESVASQGISVSQRAEFRVKW